MNTKWQIQPFSSIHICFYLIITHTHITPSMGPWTKKFNVLVKIKVLNQLILIPFQFEILSLYDFVYTYKNGFQTSQTLKWKTAYCTWPRPVLPLLFPSNSWWGFQNGYIQNPEEKKLRIYPRRLKFIYQSPNTDTSTTRGSSNDNDLLLFSYDMSCH